MRITLKLLPAALAGVLLAGCASGPGADHAAHHPGASAADGPAKMERQMAAMRDMHHKMMSAKTPEERQALMAEHMKAMQGGMAMMCDMGSGAAGAGPSDGMKRCMDMKDMTMRMMTEREAARDASRK